MELERLFVRVLGDVSDLKRQMSKGERNVEQFGYKMKEIGKSLTVGITLPITAIGVAATKMASDAEEAAAKFDVVMGDSADRVRKRFEQLHATIPLTSHEMEGLSASVQDLLVPMGVVRDRAADMSAEFVSLAGDIGAFNNLHPEQVMQAFMSALAGEAEPVRRFGIDVRKTALEAIALEHGLIRTGEAMNRTAQAQAVLIAITQDSQDAIGAAAREADNASAQFKFFARNVKELSITIGNELLPVVTPLVQRLNETLAAAEGVTAGIVQWSIAIGATSALFGPLLFGLGALTKAVVALKVAFGLMAGPAAAIALGVGAVVAALSALTASSIKAKLEAAEFAAKLDEAAKSAKGMTEAVKDLTLAKQQAVMADLASGVAMLRARRDAMAEELEAAKAAPIQAIPGGARIKELAVQEAAGQLADAERQVAMFESMIAATARGFGSALEEAEEAAKITADAWKKLAANIGFQTRGLAPRLAGVPGAPPIIQRSATTGAVTVNAEGGFLGRVTSSRPAPEREGGGLGDRLRSQLDSVIGVFKEGFSDLFSGMGNFVSGMASLFNPLKIIATVFNQALREAVAAMQPLIDAVGPLVATIAEALAPAFEALAPVIRKLSPAITALATAFSGIIVALAPLLEALVPIINLAVRALSVLIQAVGYVVLAFGALVDFIISAASLGFNRDNFGDDIKDFGRGLVDAGAAARRALNDTAAGAENAAAGLQEMARALNAPGGFKVNLARFNASNPRSMDTATFGGGLPRERGPTFTGPITIMAGNSPREAWENFRRGVERAAASGDALARNLSLGTI